MKMKTKLVSIVMAAMLLAALGVLAACSQPQASSSSSSSSEAMEVEDKSVSASEAAAAELSKEPFYVLVAGSDSRTGTVEITKEDYADGTGRSDTIMLVRVDPANYKFTLVSIPRDTQDELGGSHVKINERFRWGGAEDLMNAVEGLTGVRPKYYLTTTFVGFEDLINAMGGLSIYVPFDQSMVDIVSGNDIAFAAGDQTLDGAQALVFARERKKYNDLSSVGGEPYRQSNDRMIVQVAIMQILKNKATAHDVSKALLGFVDTNWDADEFLAYVDYFAEGVDKITFLSGSGPFEGGTDGETGMWMAYRDEATWKAIMDVVNQGGDPNEVMGTLSLYE